MEGGARREAVELLLARMSAPDAPTHQRVLYPTLIERASVAPPRERN